PETDRLGIEKEVTAMLERLQKDSEVMSDAEKRRLQQDIETRRNDLAYEGQKYQRAIESRQQELFAGIDQKVQKAIEELVKADDYDLILSRQQVVYAGDLYDITRKVTEKLNGMK
ncbi:MAG: OmpH family outer membrane protein, partial [Gammaproteobacteria bacterium]|nr:OmpH family outer membrane protein [Gammaproteobacteria bacterium]